MSTIIIIIIMIIIIIIIMSIIDIIEQQTKHIFFTLLHLFHGTSLSNC